MSISDPSLNNVEERRFSNTHTTKPVADANTVLQKAIQQLPAGLKGSIILRCDELARLPIDEEILEKVFCQLLALITEGKETDTKLFLHITCSKKTNPHGEKIPTHFRHLVQFHTNLTPLAGRMDEATQRMNAVASLLSPFNGTLSVNQLKNSGSVFAITLPGK